MDFGWKFRLEKDISSDYIEDYFGTFNENTKTGCMSGPASASFYDEDWECIDLPHDWPLGLPATENGSAGNGYKQQGIAWYRKSFFIPDEYNGKRILLKFDGIAIDSVIYLNDIKIAVSESAYTPITVDVTDFILYGNHNVISVYTDNRVKEGWWYEGGGIYRHTYMIVTDSDYFKENGVFAYSEKNSDNTFNLTLKYETETSSDCIIKTIFDGKEYIVPANGKTVQKITAVSPLLWDIDSPNLYEIKSQIIKNDKIIDEITTKFGFRDLHFDSGKGFFINGRNIKLKGVCMHHDHACTGVAVPEKVHEYRVKKLKEMGCNAIRTSHNPQSPEFYDVCDRLGMLVMNEARHFSSTEECLHQLEKFVRRDRNHPSVFMWSIYNEEPLQDSPSGEKIAKTMKKTIFKNDATRPVTGAMNGGPFGGEGVIKCVDVFGMNYLQYEYDRFHKAFPDIPLFGSENASFMSTRGITDENSELHTVCNGRLRGNEYANPNLFQWSATPGETWKAAEERDFVAGIFSWTGMDYRGECKDWPRLVCNFGAMDLCGFPKDTFYWYKSLWSDEYVIFLSPDTGLGSTSAKICCFSNAEETELILNGKSIYKGKNNRYDPKIHNISCENAVIEAVGYVDGKEVCRTELKSYGEPKTIEAELSEEFIYSDKRDAVIVNICLKDEFGTVVGDSSEQIVFEVKGGGKIVGVGNGSNASHECETGDTVKLFNGHCQTVIQSNGGNENITLKIKAGILEKTVVIPVKHKEIPEFVSSQKCRIPVNKWRKTDILDYYPKDKLTDLMFAWIPANIAKGSNFNITDEYGFCFTAAAYRLDMNYTDNAELHIDNFEGEADIYINNELRLTALTGNIEIPLKKSDFGIQSCITVVFKLNGKKCGIYGDTYFTF